VIKASMLGNGNQQNKTPTSKLLLRHLCVINAVKNKSKVKLGYIIVRSKA